MGDTPTAFSSFRVSGIIAAPATPMTEDWSEDDGGYPAPAYNTGNKISVKAYARRGARGHNITTHRQLGTTYKKNKTYSGGRLTKAATAVNLEAIPSYTEKLIQEGLSGLYINGTLGEGVALTVDERKRTTEAWLAASKGRLKYIIAHIGAGNMHDSIELAKHAEKAGASAIACVCPTYFKATSVEGLILYMKNVAAAAPTLPFYLYEINQVTGNQVSIPKFFEEVGDQIPTLRGMKYSNLYMPPAYNVSLMQNGRYQVMTGTDDQMLFTASLGLKESIVSGYLGRFCVRLVRALEAGNLEEARKQQDKLRKMSNLLAQGPTISVAKLLTSLTLGIEMGPARPPHVPLSRDVKQSLNKQLVDMGYFDWKKEL